MFKTVCLIVALVAVVAYSNDNTALDSWSKTGGNVAVGITHAVKESGHFIHQALREDETIADHVANAAEDVSYTIAENATMAKVAAALINSKLPIAML
jgi:hypothetical protein